MKKFILVVPSNDKEVFSINKNYIKNLKNFDIPYYICDYNIKNIDYDSICGILITGGGDVDPALYNSLKHHKTDNICLERDIFEISILKYAFTKKIPVLAICRGVQIMNVAFGGTLNQHIDSHSQLEPKNVATHYVDIVEKTLLKQILGDSSIKVNSFHHQVIDKVADGFKICAKCDNIIEAIEHKDKDLFFLGVQWHPEALYDKYSLNIFKNFIKSCKT